MVRHDPLGRRLESWFGLFPQLFLIWKQNPPLFLPCKKNPQCSQVFNSECSQLQTWERSDLSSWEHNMIGCSELQSWERSQVLTWEHSLNQSDCVPKYWRRNCPLSIILPPGVGSNYSVKYVEKTKKAIQVFKVRYLNKRSTSFEYYCSSKLLVSKVF